MRGRGPAAAIIAAVLAVAGCAPATPATPRPTPTTTPSISAPPVTSASAPSPSSVAEAVLVDPTLLGVLPGDIEGRPLQPDVETAAGIVATGDLAADIEAIAVGLYIGPGASSGSDDLAVVNVVRLRPGVFGDGWFRSWRSTYDDGACEVAGGVAPGSVQTRIGEHDTHIGSCQGGVHTYHVHLASPDRVISITATGERRFGERVVAGLTE